MPTQMLLPRHRRPLSAAIAIVLATGAFLFVLLAPRTTPSPPGSPTPPSSVGTMPATATAPTTQWHRPRFDQLQAPRRRMVDRQIADRGVKDPDVLAALRHVPRHRFIPAGARDAAYEDRPVSIGFGQTISQPYIVALMTELLDVQPGDKVLEVGTGSGYQAAVLSELTPNVFTIEIIERLADRAAATFKQLGYRTIRARCGDGYFGWKLAAPFDGIIVTAAAGHIPPPLRDQLKPGGRIVIPIGGIHDVQRLVVATKGDDGRLRTRSVGAVRFVPMTGEMLKK